MVEQSGGFYYEYLGSIILWWQNAVVLLQSDGIKNTILVIVVEL